MARHPSGRGAAVTRDVTVGPLERGYCGVELRTDRGPVACRYYRAPGASRAVVYVGGVGGGWDTPARGLYPRLCEDLQGEGIAGLRVRFRDPRLLSEAAHDVLAGLRYLESDGIEAAAAIGHSFGGAVVIRAAALWPNVRTVVTLATQSYGAEPVVDLAPGASILLVHGTDDEVLPPRCSELLYGLAREPKRLLFYDGAGHVLDEAAEEVRRAVRDWLVEQLRAGGE